jgi:hypothetical protein
MNAWMSELSGTKTVANFGRFDEGLLPKICTLTPD